MLRRALLVLLLIPACTAAERTWVGGAGSWSDASHWSPSGAPAAGDSLVFPAVGADTTATNDISGLSIVALKVAPQWTLDGKTLSLTGSLGFTGTGRAHPLELPLVLAAPTVVIDVPANLSAALLGGMMGPGGLRKTGAGVLVLPVVNGFDGAAEIAAGLLAVADGGTLGSIGAGTTVLPGARLGLAGATIAEPLTLSGDGSGSYGALTAESMVGSAPDSECLGPITLAANARVVARTSNDDLPPGDPKPTLAAARLTLSGAIGGPGRLTVETTGGSSVILAGSAANTHAGGTTLRRGKLVLGKAADTVAVPGSLAIGGAGELAVVATTALGQFAPASVVTATSPGGLVLGGDDAIAGLAGNGTVALEAHVLQVGAGNASSTWSGDIVNRLTEDGPVADLGHLTKIGGGTLTWSASPRPSSFGGGISVEDGVMAIDASIPEVDVVALGRGTVTGTGRVGALSAGYLSAGNGTIDPGRVGGIGRIACASLTLVGTGRLVTDLEATTNDVVQVDGPVALSGGGLAPNALTTALRSSGYLIIENDGTDAVSGTFPGWSPAAINYAAGTGNDVNIAPKLTVKLGASAARIDESSVVITFTATISGDPASAVSADWITADGSARAGEDYAGGSGTLTWVPGGPRGRVLGVTILDDATPEPDETFTVALTTTTGPLALTAPSVATVTIAKNDGYIAPPPPPISGGGGVGGGGCGSGAAAIAVAGLALALALGRRR